MCGICGVVGDTNREQVERMLARIAHRGPDDEGIYLSPASPGGSRAPWRR